jgi:hypothetical protein
MSMQNWFFGDKQKSIIMERGSAKGIAPVLSSIEIDHHVRSVSGKSNDALSISVATTTKAATPPRLTKTGSKSTKKVAPTPYESYADINSALCLIVSKNNSTIQLGQSAIGVVLLLHNCDNVDEQIPRDKVIQLIEGRLDIYIKQKRRIIVAVGISGCSKEDKDLIELDWEVRQQARLADKIIIYYKFVDITFHNFKRQDREMAADCNDSNTYSQDLEYFKRCYKFMERVVIMADLSRKKQIEMFTAHNIKRKSLILSSAK